MFQDPTLNFFVIDPVALIPWQMASGWLTQQLKYLFWPSIVEAEKSGPQFSQPPL